MIGKTKVGKSFKGCVNYNLSKVESGIGEILECRGVREDRLLMIRDFNQGRFANPKLGRPVWHTSLSFQDNLSNDEMLVIAKDWMEEMGLDKTQYVVLAHHDTSHPHLHIVANRIEDSGKTISDSNNWPRSQAVCAKLIQKYSLSPVPSVRNEKYININKLKGRDLVKSHINRVLEEILPKVDSLDHFTEMMGDKGINCELLFNTDEKFVGLVFKKDNVRIKSSDLGIQSSELMKALIDMEPKEQNVTHIRSKQLGI